LLPSRSRYRTVTPTLSGTLVLRNGDGSVESGALEAAWSLAWKSGRTLTPSLEAAVEDLRAPLMLPEDAVVPAGRYSFLRANLSYGPPFGPLFRSGADLSLGTFYGGWSADLSLGPTWNVSRHLEIGGTYRVTFIRFPEWERAFETHVGGIRIQTALNKQVSLNSFVQYNSAFDLVSTNVRFRYNFKEGSDLWVVYNEGFNVDRTREVPWLPLTNDRTILVKYSHTFTL
jgi:hypothetical protein